jgi:uncharacterized protein (DUF2235 family)
MALTRLRKRLVRWLARQWTRRQTPEAKRRGPRTHVIILDGTMSSLTPGFETHAGVTYGRCREMGAELSVYYEAGVQLRGLRSIPDVLMGRGVVDQIGRAYGVLASRYKPGDRVFLFGYSRGAYAVRSLAGAIDRVGLVRSELATETVIRTALRHYQNAPDSMHAKAFAAGHCHHEAPIEMVGVWDTVKALGLRLPFLWMLTEPKHAFHNHRLGPTTRNGFHALARDERRLVYTPVMWRSRPDWEGCLEQVWFPGTHGDVGGQLGGFEPARPLANLSLVWMLDHAEDCGLPLPANWRARFYTDPTAPSVGQWRGWGKIFWLRGRRQICTDRSEQIYEEGNP